VGIAPVKSRAETKGLTGGARLPEEERLRESEASAVDGWGRSVSGRRGASVAVGPCWAMSGGGGGGARRGREREWAENGPAEEGEGFPFSFYFLFSFSP
jgi:hypothetical protein